MSGIHRLVLVIPLSLAGASSFSDVVIEETVSLDGVGGFSMLAMQGKTTTNLTADKSRLDSDMQFKSKLMNRFAGKAGNTSQIVRLDQGRVYDLTHADKQYTEMTFEEIRAAMQQAVQQMDAAAQQQQAAQPLPVSADDCQWSEPVVEAKQTGEHATIAGFDAARATVSLKQSCTDAKTGKTCDMVWTIDQWLASAAPGSEESAAFALNYAKQLKIDAASLKAMQARMQQAFSQYKGTWTEIMTKAAQFQGYPVKNVLQMSMGGPQCTTESGTQVAADPMFADAVDAGMQAGASTATSQAASAAGQTAAEQMGGGVTGSVAGSAVGAFASKLGGSLLSKMKKKEPSAPAPEAAPAASAGMIRLFRVTSETTSIRSGPLPATTFDVPAGYTKVVPKS
jgi:hypothetical protein